KKGLSKAAKKSGRVAAEGLVAVKSAGTAGAVVEVNSETDFVARNEQFQGMVRDIVAVALDKNGDDDAIKAATFPGQSHSVEDHLKEMVGTIGENMSFRRANYLQVSDGVVASYVHNKVVDGAGKIGVLVALESTGDKEKLEAFGRQVAMHIAALSPLALREEDISQDQIEKERAIVLEREKQANPDRPEEHLVKRVDKMMGKEFFQQVVLLQQSFVLNQKQNVEAAVNAAEKDVGAPVAIKGYVRMMLGEGIEKEEGDFAAEVAAAVKG
ncbi:MAG: translation elongation factor Ts, partial [Pseudomonadota bacterium]